MKKEPRMPKCKYLKYHTKQAPKEYAAFFGWANKTAKTHRNMACPVCGLYALWVLK